MKAWNWNGNKSCEMTEEARALCDKMPPLHSALTCTNTSRRVVPLEVCVCVHLSAFGSRGFAREGGFSFQFIVWFLFFFFFFPSSTFCRRWHITISGQKSSLLSSPREAVPVSLFRWTSGGAWRAFWLNPVSFPLDTLYLNTMHGAEPGCAGESSPPLSPMGYNVHN